MVKLTKAQWRMLRSTLDGTVIRYFDVYGGYWWVERGKRLPAYGKSERFPPLPIRELLKQKLIAEGETIRPSSGSQEMAYRITDLGRQALSNNRRGE